LETDMKRPKDTSHAMPQHDYQLALQTAVSWLGDRYLLAEPVARRSVEYKPFFAEPKRWHDLQRANGPANRRH
jgi:hypothetical protein